MIFCDLMAERELWLVLCHCAPLSIKREHSTAHCRFRDLRFKVCFLLSVYYLHALLNKSTVGQTVSKGFLFFFFIIYFFIHFTSQLKSPSSPSSPTLISPSTHYPSSSSQGREGSLHSPPAPPPGRRLQLSPDGQITTGNK